MPSDEPSSEVVCHGTWSHDPVTMEPLEGKYKGSVQCPTCGVCVDVE